METKKLLMQAKDIKILTDEDFRENSLKGIKLYKLRQLNKKEVYK